MSLYHLFLQDHLEQIRAIVSSHIEADIVLVASRQQIHNRIALAQWADPDRKDRILLSSTISVSEQMSIILDLGAATGTDPLVRECINLLFQSSFHILALVVLHEVAHIKYGWDRSRDRECTSWALGLVGDIPALPMD